MKTIDELFTELEKANKAKSKAEKEIKAAFAGITELYKAKTAALLKEKDEPFGTVNITDGDFTLKFTIPKNIKWDQDKLGAKYAEIARSNENPLDYIKVEYDVSETKFKAWPEVIKSEFLDARTVTPGKTKIEIEKV